MKKTLIIAVIMLGCMIASTNNMYAESAAETSSAQQNETTVQAVYYNNGVSSILIKVANFGNGLAVTAYCSGRDYMGRQIWESIQAVSVRANDYRPYTSDGTWERTKRNYKYKATLGQLTLYFNL